MKARILASNLSAKTMQRSTGPNMIIWHAAITFLLADMVILVNSFLATCAMSSSHIINYRARCSQASTQRIA